MGAFRRAGAGARRGQSPVDRAARWRASRLLAGRGRIPVVTHGVMSILLGAFLALITAWSLGRLLLRTLRASLCRLEEDLFAVLAGSVCLSGLVFLLCFIHLARKGVFAVLCAASIGTAFWRGALRPAA